MKAIKWIIFCLILMDLVGIGYATKEAYFVQELSMQPLNRPSLQRGAHIYFNYCSTCHSLQYESYQHIAQMVGLDVPHQHIYEALIKKSFLFDEHGDVHEAVVSSMDPKEAAHWFGVAPPDLTNVTLIRSPAWVYNFLRAFYHDDKAPFGANNLVMPNTKMPNVLLPLRGDTQVVLNNGKFDHLVTTKAGSMKPLEFDQAMYDLVNFLNLTAEPAQIIRVWIGIAVLALLGLLLLLLYFWRSTFNHIKTRNEHE